jgi:hypothetical protein
MSLIWGEGGARRVSESKTPQIVMPMTRCK